MHIQWNSDLYKIMQWIYGNVFLETLATDGNYFKGSVYCTELIFSTAYYVRNL